MASRARTKEQIFRLRKRIAALPQAARNAVQPSLDKSADELVARMQSFAPQDDGTLIASIRKTPGDHELARKVRAGDKAAFYARFVEFGTPKSPAQPFFFPTFRLLRKRIQGRTKRAVAKAVRETWKP
ncbi:MAG: HK97-gp10 family putative phage morphogenesis protein [Thermoanaerobaculia bacterium]